MSAPNSVEVTVGLKDGDYTEITGGLQEGDRLSTITISAGLRKRIPDSWVHGPRWQRRWRSIRKVEASL